MPKIILEHGVKVNCVTCNNEFRLYPSDIKSGKKNCSRACQREFQRNNPNSGTFKIGRIKTAGFIRGDVHSIESVIKMSNLKRGKTSPRKNAVLSKETRLKISKSNIGRTVWNKGKNYKDDGVIHGSKHWNWNGGTTKDKYIGFTKLVKFTVRKRDEFKCRVCFKSEQELGSTLCVHHIDYNKENSSINNLISLCRSCHYITNYNRSYWMEQFNNRVKIYV